MLLGRDDETARLVDLLGQARRGSPAALVVRGEPGVGKSALLDALVAGADDALILRTRGLEAESPLAFAGLHRLLLPVMRLVTALPGPQARALRVAFGEQDGPSVKPFLVAAATLSMLTAAAEERTVLGVVDDAHWLDSATADALLFCARRLGADRVLMVFAARDAAATFRPDDLPEMRLTGLNPAASRGLLARRPGDPPPPEVADRLVAASGGNPLALLELPAEPGPGPLPLPDRLEKAFLDRTRSLPAPVRLVLLLAGADDTGDLAILRQAAAALELGEAAFEAAVASGLLLVEGRAVTVRHPLVRSAIYQAATGEQRRRVHRTLADASAGLGDPDREAWHRAAAADGPDPAVAAALELAGSRSEQRGAFASAFAAYARAAALTTADGHRARLTVAAARNAWASGRTAESRELLATARRLTDDPVLLGDVARLLGRIEVNVGSAGDAHRILTEAAHAIHEADPARALEMAVAAAIMAAYGADGGVRLEPGDIDTEVTAADSPRTRCLKQMLVAMTRAAEAGWAAAVAALDDALRTGDRVTDLDVLGNLGNAALLLGDDRAQQRFYSVTLSRAREAGAAMTMIYALHRLCFGHLVAGDWVALRGSAEEALALATGLGQRALTAPPLAWLTLLAALQGADDYETLLGQVVPARSLGILTDPVHDLTRWARGAHAAASADTFGALHHFSRMRLPVLARMAAAERIDAAVRAGDLDLARRWVRELAGFAGATGRPWALATVAYGTAMTGDPADADRLFRAALAHHAHAGRLVDQGRTHLAYGEWLRRSQRRLDARLHLRQACEIFSDLHAEALVQRATEELRVAGETARRRDPSTAVKLTPMELKVAQLVASGLSNKDVAAQIWVSPRTVAFHLRNVFAKAGITSRGELARLNLAI